MPHPSPETCELARELLARVARETPDLLPEASAILRRLLPCRHSIDFASVVWCGVSFTFSGTQAAIVKALWEAWENGTPDVRQETLIAAGGGEEGSRLRDVFRDSPAWDAMIVPGTFKGTFRLCELSQKATDVGKTTPRQIPRKDPPGTHLAPPADP